MPPKISLANPPQEPCDEGDHPQWQMHRRVVQPRDRFLIGDTVRLLFGLPRGIRPIRLQEEFPRIANELPNRWSDTPTIRDYLSELLEDRRGNRRGFPALVREELEALKRFVDQRPNSPPDSADGSDVTRPARAS
jgi:hypothetical protein